ncbi:MAG: signal peptidase II [Lachnospiraceae bacterium]|nr:signal peptidase II [Lachnospiraceae bacterium]
MERKTFLRDCLFHALLFIFILVADQVTKSWARADLANAPIILWKDVFSLRLIYNTGASFGIFNKYTSVLTIFSVAGMIAFIAIYFLLPKERRMRPMRFTLTLIIAGGIGNSIDRIVFGKVTDMFSFDLINFPVFNVADIGVTCGAILMCVLWIFYYKDEDFKKWKKSSS